MACNTTQGPLIDKSKPEFRLFARDCAQELNLGFLAEVERFRSNRTLVVDERIGLALDLALLDWRVL
jgi:hypothetical protein